MPCGTALVNTSLSTVRSLPGTESSVSFIAAHVKQSQKVTLTLVDSGCHSYNL
jgi:hypothetical protein